MMPPSTNFIDRSWSVRGAPRGAACAPQKSSSPPLQAAPDRRQRTKQADDAARRHRARADVEDVGAADLRPATCP